MPFTAITVATAVAWLPYLGSKARNATLNPSEGSCVTNSRLRVRSDVGDVAVYARVAFQQYNGLSSTKSGFREFTKGRLPEQA